MNYTANYVLFVDDDPDDQEIVLDCCNELQLANRAKFVQSGDELFQFLAAIKRREDFPSLIVLDINMPGLNGEEVLLLLKRNSHYKDIPVIFYSTGSRFRSKYIELGAQAFHNKPYSYEQHMACVASFFRHLQQTSLS